MSRTREVFEHGKLRVSDGDDGISADEFDALVRFNDRHGGAYFEVGHNHLRAKQYVGYIEVGDLSIEVLPKADRGAGGPELPWRDGLVEMLRVGLGLRLAPLPDAGQRLTRSRLLDLIARAYLDELEPLLHAGLAKGYRATRSNGTVFRGRLAMAEHLRANVARGERLFVEYQTFDHDIAINRVLAAALEALSWCALTPAVAGAVDACLADLPELEPRAVDPAVVAGIRLNRATERYGRALVYARMILAQQGPQLRHGRERVFALRST
jgi:5-methylcytosine-specific restriction enzyme subunit McrC